MGYILRIVLFGFAASFGRTVYFIGNFVIAGAAFGKKPGV